MTVGKKLSIEFFCTEFLAGNTILSRACRKGGGGGGERGGFFSTVITISQVPEVDVAPYFR